MQSQTVLVSGALGMLGTALGVVLNHMLSSSSQRVQRIEDAKKAEYRELLSVMNESFMTMLELGRPGITLSAEQERELLRAQTNSVRVIADRLYISNEVIQMDVMKRWTQALNAFRTDRNIQGLAGVSGSISEEIRRAALKV